MREQLEYDISTIEYEIQVAEESEAELRQNICQNLILIFLFQRHRSLNHFLVFHEKYKERQIKYKYA
jgi:hypothetical protein